MWHPYSSLSNSLSHRIARYGETPVYSEFWSRVSAGQWKALKVIKWILQKKALINIKSHVSTGIKFVLDGFEVFFYQFIFNIAAS